MPDRASITVGDLCSLHCNATVISDLIPDRAPFDHFCSQKTKKKSITVFDQSSSNFGIFNMNKLSNF